jgi:hypothetical protein
MLAVCRETGHLAKIASLLQLPAERSRRNLPREVAANLLSALDTFLLLITTPSPSVKKVRRCQNPDSLRFHSDSFWAFFISAYAPQFHDGNAQRSFIWILQDKALEESCAANRATLMRQGALDGLLTLALAHGGVGSPPVRGQVCGGFLVAFWCLLDA